MLFGFSINYSTYLAAETNHTFKKNLEQPLSVRRNRTQNLYTPKQRKQGEGRGNCEHRWVQNGRDDLADTKDKIMKL